MREEDDLLTLTDS